MKKIVLNNKSYLDYNEFKKYKSELEKIDFKDNKVIWLPPMVYLSELRNSKIPIGSQNFYSYVKGSYTGETNLETLKTLNINNVLLGHFERKSLGLESYSIIKDKLYKSLSSKFNTILCIGEKTSKENAIKFLKKELKYLTSNLDEDSFKYLTLAYEPGWAIGGHDILEIDKMEKIIKTIKKYFNKHYNIDIEILYGGSVDSTTIKEVLNICDGVLLGRASLDIKELKELVKKIN